MGACIAKIGRSDVGRILFCLPLCVAELLWGAVFLTLAGLQCDSVITYIQVNASQAKDWLFWFGTILTFASFLLVLCTGIGCVLAAFMTKWTNLGWLKTLTIIQLFSVLVNFIVYIIDNVEKYFCDTCLPMSDEQMNMFISTLVFDILVIIFFYFMMETHKSLRSVRRVNGTGWEGKSSQQLTGTSRPGNGRKSFESASDL